MSNSARPTLIVACLATAMLMLDIAVVNTAIPHIGADLHAGTDALKWIVDAYTLALAVTVLTVGSIADRVGRRSVPVTPGPEPKRPVRLQRTTGGVNML